MRRAEWIGTRWLGVGLAAILAVVTLGLAVTGRLSLYINPDSTWFAVSMAVVALVGAVASFALPLGAEADHGHDHGDSRTGDPVPAPQLVVHGRRIGVGTDPASVDSEPTGSDVQPHRHAQRALD